MQPAGAVCREQHKNRRLRFRRRVHFALHCNVIATGFNSVAILFC